MQAVSIKGYVIDKKTNEPIIGAIVTIEGQNIGAQTDFDGRFVIKDVESGTDKLVVKSIGYKDHTRTITISDKDDIWYCTNIELYDYIRAFNSLDISADMKIVHNPTSVKIWVDWNGSIHMIDAGETVKL